MPVPRLLTNFNLIVAGAGFAGRVDEIELPTLRMKVEEHRGGGMDAPIGMDLGMEPITCSFTMAEHVPEVFGSFGIITGSDVVLSFRGAMNDGVTFQGYQVDVTGMYTELEMGTLKAGEKTQLKASVMARFYRLTVNGAVLHEIDIENMIRIIDGTDQLAEMRALLMI